MPQQELPFLLSLRMGTMDCAQEFNCLPTHIIAYPAKKLKSESTSISNQKKIVEAYCKQHGITILKYFVDDGWSGGNFERPGFQEMMRALESGKANVVITKDLSRLGRDMRESSYYAEQFFPENQIRYIAIADNFDSETENVMAPFQFAMNEVYLRDGSRKSKMFSR